MKKIEKDSIFIIIPFKNKFQNAINLAFKPAIVDAGFIPTIANGDIPGTDHINDDIVEKIEDAIICIADLSIRYDNNGKAIPRGNVFIEVGIALAANKHVILLCSDASKEIPYDIQYLRAIEYNPDDLSWLKEKLMMEIKERNMRPVRKLFNDIEYCSPNMLLEYERLRDAAHKLTIEVEPPTADIFLNGNYIGESPQEIYFNDPNTNRTTLSITAPAHFEEHFELNSKNIDEKLLTIRLEKVDLSNKSELLSIDRMYNWLEYRSDDPQNPVVMRAIGQYFGRLHNKEQDQDKKHHYLNKAKEEIEKLLDIAPKWNMAYNQMGVIYLYFNEHAKSLHYYQLATLHKPDNYLGYFNQACAYARLNNFEMVLSMLETFKNNSRILISYAYSNMMLSTESAFDSLKNDKKYTLKFIEIVSEIDTKAHFLKLESRYWSIYRKMYIEQYINPLNIEEEKIKFKNAYSKNQRYNPQFVYKEFEFDFNNVIKDLNNLKNDFLNSTHSLQPFYLKLIEEAQASLLALKKRDTADFVEWLTSLYRKPSDKLISFAEKELKTINNIVKDPQIFNANKVAKIFRNSLEDKDFYDWDIVVEEMPARMSINQITKTVKIKASAMFAEKEIERLKVHEIDTHILRAENAARQPYLLFKYGFPDYLKTEEGLAIFTEEQDNLLSDYDREKYAMRVLACNYVFENSFYEVFELLHKRIDIDDAFTMTVRVKRGIRDTSRKGGYTKDQVYLDGYRMMKQQNNEDIRKLYFGKIGLHNLLILDELKELNSDILYPKWIKNIGLK